MQFLLIVLTFAAAADAKDDLEKLQGTYMVVDAARNGRKPPADVLKTMVVTIKGNKISIGDGKRDESINFKLDASTKPKSIDFVKDPDEKPAVGIYELSGDNVKLCWQKRGGARPKSFDNPPDAGVSMLILKRKPKGK